MANLEHGAEGQARGEAMRLVRLALPITLGQWVQVAMHTIDTAMLGRLGVETVAASSMGAIVLVPFFMGIGAVGAALPPLVAQALGAGDRGAAARWLRHGRACALVLSVLSVAVFAGVVGWLPESGQPTAVVEGARTYGLIVIWSMIPVMMLQNLRGWAEAHGRPWLPMGNIAVGLVVNVAANALLIYGLGPVPALGLTGAALGTCVARLVMWGHFAWVLRGQADLRPVATGAATGPWSREILGRYLKLGLPTAAATLLVVGTGVVLVFLAARLGPTALAAHEIARQMWALSYILPFGWSMAVALRCAHWVGAGDAAALRHCARMGLGIGAAMGVTLGVGLGLSREWWPLVFLGAEAAGTPAAELGARVVGWAAAWVGCEGVLLAAAGVCRGMVRMVPVAVTYLGAYWMVGPGLAYGWGQPERWGLPGLWAGMVGGVAAGTLVLVAYTWRQVRRVGGG